MMRRFRAFLGGAQSGHTLVDLAAGLVVAGIVTAAGYRLFTHYNSQAVLQKRIAAAQAELMPLQSALERNLRRAGYGVPLKSPRWRSGSPADTVAAIVLADNGSLPDGLTLRGNFSGAVTQARADFPRSATRLDVRLGTAGQFAAGDIVALENSDVHEYVTVASVDAANSRLTTGARLNDYPAGTRVIKVTTVEFRPSGADLLLVTNGRTQRLCRNLQEVRFYLGLRDGSVDSLPPFPIEDVQSILYGVRVRVPKPGNRGQLLREVTGRVQLRNSL
jgi:hypothetical protein